MRPRPVFIVTWDMIYLRWAIRLMILFITVCILSLLSPSRPLVSNLLLIGLVFPGLLIGVMFVVRFVRLLVGVVHKCRQAVGYGIVWRRLLFLCAIICTASLCAYADGYHTVGWFAAHPQECLATVKWCNDNAGLAPANPDCINAAEASCHATDTSAVPTEPRYWVENPRDVPTMLWMCRMWDQAHVKLLAFEAGECTAVRSVSKAAAK
jgi:hypothetical protein